MFLATTVDIQSQLTAQGANLDLGSFFSTVFNLALVLSGVAVFLYLIWAGYNWLTAGGDKAKVEEARGRITNALIGIAIVASAWAFFRIVDRFFGIGITPPPGGGAAGPPTGTVCSDCNCAGVGFCDGHCVNTSSGNLCVTR